MTKAEQILRFIGSKGRNGASFTQISKFCNCTIGGMSEERFDKDPHAYRGYYCDALYGHGGLLYNFCAKFYESSDRWVLIRKPVGPFYGDNGGSKARYLSNNEIDFGRMASYDDKKEDEVPTGKITVIELESKTVKATDIATRTELEAMSLSLLRDRHARNVSEINRLQEDLEQAVEKKSLIKKICTQEQSIASYKADIVELLK